MKLDKDMYKKIVPVAGVIVLVTSLIMISLMGHTNPRGGEKIKVGEKLVERGPHWHPPGSPNHYSVRYAGYDPPHDNKYPDAYIPVNVLETTQNWTIGLQMYNHENRELWFTIEDNGTTGDWVIDQKEMGSVAGDGGQDSSWTFTITRENISDDLGTPVVMESVELSITSYEDSGYSELYTRDNFKIDFHFIDRKDPGWTTIDMDDFDDNSVEGWDFRGGYNDAEGVSLNRSMYPSNRLYRSDPYSLEFEIYSNETSFRDGWCEIVPYKSFDISSGYSEAYFIATIRSEQYQEKEYSQQFVEVHENGVEYFRDLFNVDKWYKLCIPLPTGENTEVSLDSIVEEYIAGDEGGPYYHRGWMDNIYVIAR